MAVDARLASLLEPTISGLGYDLLGIEQRRVEGGLLVRIYIDRESGITLDDCARVSNQVSGVIDVEGALRGAYTLEVSSPGVDRPLFTPDQYRKFVGAAVQMRLRSLVHGRRNLAGTLVGVRDEMVSIDAEGEVHEVPFNLIERTRLVPAWPDKG